MFNFSMLSFCIDDSYSSLMKGGAVWNYNACVQFQVKKLQMKTHEMFVLAILRL